MASNDMKPELSLTPIIENANLLISPQLVDNNNLNNMNNTDGILTLTNHSKHHKKQAKPKSKPAFVMKLWTMVNDESNKSLIDWLPDGKAFLVSNRELFVQKILPKYFKHSNFASFVRQLNMYGWHKVQDASSGSLHSDEKWQFENPNFQKGRPELLEKIVRNKPHEETGLNDETRNLSQLDVTFVVEQLQTLKQNQLKITHELTRVREDNDLLWQELFQTREKNLLQNDKIERILQFLASVYGNKVKGLEDNVGGQSSQLSSQVSNLNNSRFEHVPHEEESTTLEKPRLMLKQYRHVSNGSTNNSTGTTSPEFNDNSPIQEIIRSPQDTNPNIQHIQPYELSEFSPNNKFIPQDIQHIDPSVNNNINNNNSNNINTNNNNINNNDNNNVPNGINNNNNMKSLLPSNPSYKELYKSIEQQGQSIDDLITKLQTSTPTGQGPSDKFDIDEFLNEDFDDLDDGEIEEIERDNHHNPEPPILKRKEDDDQFDDGEIEEIINPNKKRKSDQFL